MNYIPGFSNYLEASVPEYGPAPIMDAPRQPAVEPMTQEAVAPAAAPYSLSGLTPEALAGLYALSANNAGGSTPSGMAGLPSLGAGYVPQFEEKLITAPVSNKGNATAYSGMDNQFYMSPNDLVRLVDRSTNTVVFEGTGYEAAQKAVELGQGMTDAMGRKADYQIETGKTQDSYAPVANEKYNKSTLSKVANVAGTVLPMAMMAIPGVNAALLGTKFAATIPGQMAFGALTGGASSALKGQDILKGAALGGLTAAGGALIPKVPAIGDLGNLAKPLGVGIGATAGGLATGQNLQNALLGGAASGALAYAAPSIQDAFRGTPASGVGATGGAAAPTGTGPSPITTVTGSNIVSPNISIGEAKAPAPAKPAELEPPVAIVSGSGSPFAASFPIPASVLSGVNPSAQQPKPDQISEEDIIKVTGSLPGVTPSVDLGSGLSPQVIDKIAQPAETLSPEEILVEARKSFTPVSVSSPLATDFLPESVLSKPTVDFSDTVSPEEILVEARKPITPSIPVGGALSPEVLRAVEGPAEEPLIKVTGRQTTTPPVIMGVETPMPDMTETAEEAEAKKKKLGLEEYLRIAGLLSGLVGGAAGGGSQTGTYTSGGRGLNPIFSAKLPAAGGLGAVGVNRTLRPVGEQDWLTYGERPELNFYDYAARSNPAPITSPIPNNPAGPIMAERDPMAMAKGGRTEFAVNGAGTGRSDDIPAVLSDGEYVIDAETVALLGDGSSKAGAKKLDDLRVKVRKHKGQKLAKGRFSANAKKPEAYLSGGRI